MPFTVSEVSRDSEAFESVERVVIDSGTSFFWAMRLLSRQRREGMFAIYAFCREVDDIADEPASKEAKLTDLGKWREQIEKLYDNPSGQTAALYPTARALMGAVAAFNLRKEDFLAVIEGMEMDANGPIQAPSMQELKRYCDRVACAVGRLSVHAFGVPGNRGYAVADKLGQALQLTNILRDLREDAKVNRLYLPVDLLEKHGIADRVPEKVLAHPALTAVCEDLAQIARRRFEEAEAALARCSRRKMRPAIVMMRVYRKILEALQARGWHDLDRKVGISKASKIWIALRYGIL
ncbi:MAG: presqualene diphosphate synthase HpnD [Alphaproteobacteria bacterium]|nr:presqualene diphosphate synthase HpnD [Alphaproteobacteria bacterium]